MSASAQALSQDRGATGAWQTLLKLRTTASAMQTTAHPDDEDAGLLTWLARGQGTRVSLLTLNRGEGGDNAIGPELFDALGLIRTEELREAGRYYGLDGQYYTTVADYGFSKRLDESINKWGHETILGDMTRVIRRDRPFVLISRFQGNAQDGHGHHQAAGLLTREAFLASGDPKRFPEQIAEGLRPWTPWKLYTGMGFMGGEKGASVRVDVGEYSPWIGESYANFGQIGYSFHRTQFTGGVRLTSGPSFASYRRVLPNNGEPPQESGFFDGIDTTIPGLFAAIGRRAPDEAAALLGAIDREVKAATEAFKITEPSATVPALARGLKATREAIARLKQAEPEAGFVLRVKERQFEDAINAALAIELTAVAQPAGVIEPKGPFAMFAPPPVMGPVRASAYL